MTTNTHSSNALQEKMLEQANQWLLHLQENPENEQLLAEFQHWLDEDEKHEACYLEAALLWQEIDAATCELQTEERQKAVQQNTLNQTTSTLEKIPPKRQFFSKPIALSAAFLSLVLLTVLVLPKHIWLQPDIATGIAQQQTRTLSDGSILHLNGQSGVNILFSETSRTVELLYGEAFFEVASDSERPFQVIAQDILAQAIGTAFNIKYLDEGIEATLTEGKLKLELATQKSLILRAGERVLWHDSEGTQRSQGHSLYLPDWKRGLLRLDNMPLVDVLTRLNRQYPVTLKLVNPALANKPIKGILPLNDLETTLTVLETTLAVKLIRFSDQLILLH